ncbi:gluconokinase [Marinilongibacter aquaticus]|uniref:gluconokinase n=1 Tax=Marinilongibacter aquaticus TaxID=2975157 RepID=UPI0021BD16A1|nr:gluconokinase [Marinilongibacter aquaticus]UBM59204.1 gluconokinase [Marinilongibacter aquaticus]
MIIYVMGVSGSGKTTVGQRLAKELNLPFFDGDGFHPKENIAKMSAGIPLHDADRMGWLKAIHAQAINTGGVFACSALKETYRSILFADLKKDEAQLVFLDGDFDLIDKRMKSRKNHFMPPGLLQSQFNDLEVPEYGIRVSIDQSPEKIVEEIVSKLALA